MNENRNKSVLLLSNILHGTPIISSAYCRDLQWNVTRPLLRFSTVLEEFSDLEGRGQFIVQTERKNAGAIY